MNKFLAQKLVEITHWCTQTSVFIFTEISLVGRMFANGLENRGSISGHVIPKTQKMVFDVTLFNYKVWIKSKVEQSRERSSALPYILM